MLPPVPQSICITSPCFLQMASMPGVSALRECITRSLHFTPAPHQIAPMPLTSAGATWTFRNKQAGVAPEGRGDVISAWVVEPGLACPQVMHTSIAVQHNSLPLTCMKVSLGTAGRHSQSTTGGSSCLEASHATCTAPHHAATFPHASQCPIVLAAMCKQHALPAGSLLAISNPYACPIK
jgi:hypothetical protein